MHACLCAVISWVVTPARGKWVYRKFGLEPSQEKRHTRKNTPQCAWQRSSKEIIIIRIGIERLSHRTSTATEQEPLPCLHWSYLVQDTNRGQTNGWVLAVGICVRKEVRNCMYTYHLWLYGIQ